jgi:imidazolonepropionase
MLEHLPNASSGVLSNIRACDPASAGTGVLEDAALAWRDGVIGYFGPAAELPESWRMFDRIDGAGQLLMPALIDCHTHLVFAGNRADEFAARLRGTSYQEIAANGGGIMSSVRQTAAASVEELVSAALPRARALAREGVATVEIKSGYGLSLPAERAMLQAATTLGERTGLQVQRTFLALHALPSDVKNDNAKRAAWISETVNYWLPSLHAEGLVDAVDAFCEGIAFSPDEVRKLFIAARALRIPIKLHADQLSNLGGGALAAEFGALSADHLEYLDAAGIQAMRASGTVAVLLPAAFYCLKETQLPPVAQLRDAGISIAVASDCNPGTSPQFSLRLAMHQACTLFGLSIEEALRATTVHAAAALGKTDRGQLKTGLRADFALWPVRHPAELVYWLGDLPAALWVGGSYRDTQMNSKPLHN